MMALYAMILSAIMEQATACREKDNPQTTTRPQACENQRDIYSSPTIFHVIFQSVDGLHSCHFRKPIQYRPLG